MAEKTFKQMTKPELLAVLEKVIDSINIIEKKRDEIVEIRDSLDEGGLLDKIRDTHSEIVGDDDESDSLKNEIGELIGKLREYNEEIEKVRNEMYGYIEENAEGEDEEHDGYIDQMKKTFDKYKEKFQEFQKGYNVLYKECGDLYKQIESELLSGATTVSLAKNFSDQAKEYKTTRMMWEVSFVLLFILAILFVTYNFTTIEISDAKQLIYYFVRGIPFFGVFVWLAVFMGNRRAENKKLEEAYKHKEVMAKSFIGYKKSIKELSDDNKELLTKLMENLLDAMKKDSSSFLSSKGESHPVVDALKQSNSEKQV